MTATQKRIFISRILHLLGESEQGQLTDCVLAQAEHRDWSAAFGDAVEAELPRALVVALEERHDLPHGVAFLLASPEPRKALVGVLRTLDQHLTTVSGSRRLLDGMRVSRIMADAYALLSPDSWRRRRIPSCGIDSDPIVRLKEKRATDDLPQAYEFRINELQRQDMQLSLGLFTTEAVAHEVTHLQMRQADYATLFRVVSPLRLGISSANASDNHVRTKEQGGKTLNAGIDLAIGSAPPAPPLTVTVRRLAEARLVLRSLSSDFKADFEANSNGDATAQAGLFFAFRRGGDEALRMVKQGLVHAGIVSTDSGDVVADVSRFTGGGGLEIITSSQVLQGSGQGTSSVLAAAILKALYRVAGVTPTGESESDYPGLYDQSVLLEQSLGLNSGWQDARGVFGGQSAVKDFYAPPTAGLPAPIITFVDVDEALFSDRMILFDTGISRAATRGLNAVLDAYLSRDRRRYPAIAESMAIHDDMVEALRSGRYDELGQLGTRYWQLRCALDPDATNNALQYLFETPKLRDLSAGGLMTGAGGGGFALIVAKEGTRDELSRRLSKLTQRPQFARSAVVGYRLNSAGIQLFEESQ